LTLVVSARIPDGVVIGVDSLSTVGGSLNVQMDAKFKCNNCGSENEVKQMQLPTFQFPVSTKPYAQKLFKFKGKYGIGCFGNAFVNQKTMQSQIRSLEKNNPDEVKSVDEIANKILYHFEKQLHQEAKDITKIPPNVFPFGFQIVGFDDDGQGKTWLVQIGRQSTKKLEDQIGTTFAGDIALVQKLLIATGGVPQLQPHLQSFSLGDAVEFVEFLIRFVADYQRFANMIPTVGGDIDIAIVTSYSGFKWIKQKSFAKILEEEG